MKHSQLPPFFRWLVVAALLDWIVTRTITRSAIFMPKPPIVIVLYQLLNTLGQFAVALSSLLAILALLWIAWQHYRSRGEIILPVTLLSLATLSVLFIFVPAEGALAILYQLIVIAGITLIVKDSSRHEKLDQLFPALALSGASLYQLSHTIYTALQIADPPAWALPLFNVGELAFVLAPILIGRRYLLPPRWWMTLPALAFLLIHFVNPAMTGIIAIWSTGLTLYLPAVMYAISLSFVAAILIRARHGDADSATYAILLIMAGGYAPQISTQLFLGIIALWCLSPSLTRTPATQFGSTPPRNPIPEIVAT